MYFAALLPVLRGAKHRILITDWFLSSGLYLTRSSPLDKNTRLDHILLAKAEEGVHIYIQLWNNNEIVFSLQSSYIQDYFKSLHPNIHIILHPYLFGQWSWSHHQKSVVIDDKIAFVGGVDLCYGRYDTEEYKLTDIGGQHFPGGDYANACHGGEINGPSMKDNIDR